MSSTDASAGTAPEPAYRYRAELVRVVDADTLLLMVDLGFNVWTRVSVRLRGWNAPERNTEAGRAAGEFVGALLADAELLIETYKDRQTFARWVADVWVDGRPMGELLAAAGHAVRGSDA